MIDIIKVRSILKIVIDDIDITRVAIARLAVSRISSVIILFASAGINLYSAESIIEDEYREVKTIVESYADSDFAQELYASWLTLLDRGTALVPHLTRLFRETNDDHVRSAVVSALTGIGDAHPALVSLIEEELLKAESGWKGEVWVLQAFNSLRRIDPQAALRVALRLLVGSEERKIYLFPALALLRERGTLENVPALTDFAYRRRTIGGMDYDLGYAAFADEAIAIIEARGNGDFNKLGDGTNHLSDKERAIANHPMHSDSESTPSSNRSVKYWWIVGGAAILVVAFYILREK